MLDNQNLEVQLSEEEADSAVRAARKAFRILNDDRDKDLQRIQDYLDGKFDGPYLPSGATREARTLAERACTNLLVPALNAPAQALFLELHRLPGSTGASPAWTAFQRNRLGGRQSDLYRDALSLEQAFLAADRFPPGHKHEGKVRALLWGRLSTVALWEDPVNDERPAFVLHLTSSPSDDGDPGFAIAFDREHRFEFQFKDENRFSIVSTVPHGAQDTPVIPFTPYRDLRGRPRGIIKPLMPILDRINQTTYDLLIVQSDAAFKVKWASGLVPPPVMKTTPVTFKEAVESKEIADPSDPRYAGIGDDDIVGHRQEPVLDDFGNEVRRPVKFGPGQLLTLEDPQARVGTLDETPLDGYIASIEMSIKQMGAVAQIPAQFLTGAVSNLSADALAALGAALDRMITELQNSFGESWEQFFQLVAEIEQLEGADIYDTDLSWRDMSVRSLSQTVDALGKAVKMLGVPERGLWPRIPGTSAGDIAAWDRMSDQRQFEREAGVGFEPPDLPADSPEWAGALSGET